MADWQVLIVDDEADIHAVTALSLKLKKWRNRRLNLHRANSAAEARAVLARESNIQVALIDVVMESNDAGLKLCEHIRDTYSRSLRIVLRTGQPGVAPEERVLNEYDIDYYLAKVEATPERLFAVIRASLRASMEISSFMALKEQLTHLVACFRNPTAPAQLSQQMKEFLKGLEQKYAVTLTFIANAHTATDGSELFRLASLRAIETGAWEQYVPGNTVGLDEEHFVVPFRVDVAASSSAQAGSGGGLFRRLLGQPPVSAAMQPIEGALIAVFGEGITRIEKRDLLHEFNLALGQWKLAYGVLCVQQDVAFQRVFEERARRQRIEALGS